MERAMKRPVGVGRSGELGARGGGGEVNVFRFLWGVA